MQLNKPPLTFSEANLSKDRASSTKRPPLSFNLSGLYHQNHPKEASDEIRKFPKRVSNDRTKQR